LDGPATIELVSDNAGDERIAVNVGAGLGLLKKLAMSDRDFIWASFSFFSFSALAAFLSCRSFSLADFSVFFGRLGALEVDGEASVYRI